MKRLRSRLFDVAAAVSLAFCVATGVLWVRSYRVTDGWAGPDGVRVVAAGYYLAWQQMVISARGGLYYVQDRGFHAADILEYRMPPDAAASKLDMMQSSASPDPADRWFGLAGCTYFSRHGYPTSANLRIGPPIFLSRGCVIPHGLLAAVTALLPLAWLRAYRRRRCAADGGLCSTCGYDLRATPDRCPECGTPAAAATTS